MYIGITESSENEIALEVIENLKILKIVKTTHILQPGQINC